MKLIRVNANLFKRSKVIQNEEKNMTFVNEIISEEDYEKYNLKQLDKRLPWSSPTRCWTINRDENIWIRDYYTPIDRDEGCISGATIYDYWWKGTPLVVEATKSIVSDKIQDGIRYRINLYDIVSLTMPETLNEKQQEIISDLRHLFETLRLVSAGDKLPNLPSNHTSIENCKFIYQ